MHETNGASFQLRRAKGRKLTSLAARPAFSCGSAPLWVGRAITRSLRVSKALSSSGLVAVWPPDIAASLGFCIVVWSSAESAICTKGVNNTCAIGARGKVSPQCVYDKGLLVFVFGEINKSTKYSKAAVWEALAPLARLSRA